MNSRDLKTAIDKITQRGGLSNAGMQSKFRSFYFASMVLPLCNCLLTSYIGGGKKRIIYQEMTHNICIFSKVSS